MEAIVLAGGFGTRLRQIVADVPKPMAPVAGRPFLETLLSSLAQKGFSRVVLSLGFMAEKISGHFGPQFAGLDLAYVVEDTPLGTGGATKLAMTSCTQDHVFVFNGDTFLDLEVELLERQWQAKQCPIVVGRQVPDTTRYGRLLVVEGRRVANFAEKGVAGLGLINAGCYVLATDALAGFSPNRPFSIETDYLMPEIEHSTVEVFITEGTFIDIGIPEDYLRAQTLLANR
ncbi:nucleotidyltransferase family protein [Pseudomonas solani]|uniref:nucleotidyltransferase family protein n=1 Tax=Pseudomonas solani TaxID=2731552 RepID=UPI003D6BF8E2